MIARLLDSPLSVSTQGISFYGIVQIQMDLHGLYHIARFLHLSHFNVSPIDESHSLTSVHYGRVHLLQKDFFAVPDVFLSNHVVLERKTNRFPLIPDC